MPDQEGSDHAPAWADLQLPDDEFAAAQAQAQGRPLPPPLAARYLFDTGGRQATLQDLLSRRAAAAAGSQTQPSQQQGKAGWGPATGQQGPGQGCGGAPDGNGAMEGQQHQKGRGQRAGGAGEKGSTGGSQRKLTAFLRPQTEPQGCASGSHGHRDSGYGRSSMEGATQAGGRTGCVEMARPSTQQASGLAAAPPVSVVPGPGGSGGSLCEPTPYVQGEGQQTLPMHQAQPHDARGCLVAAAGRAVELAAGPTHGSAGTWRPGMQEEEQESDVVEVLCEQGPGAAGEQGRGQGEQGQGIQLVQQRLGQHEQEQQGGGRTQAALAWRQIQEQMKPPR